MICLYSPASIKECCEDDSGEPLDVFDTAVPAENPYRNELIAACWARWRYAMIDSTCVSRWLQRLSDRCALIDRRYQKMIAVYEKNSEAIAELGSSDKETRDLTRKSTPSGSDEVINTNEDIPQSQNASSETWLTGRNKTASTPGVIITDTDSGTVTREHVEPVAETLRDTMDAIRDPYAMYADELEDLFAPRWSMCRCRRERLNSCRCPAP